MRMKGLEKRTRRW